jgi:hypothetical protein
MNLSERVLAAFGCLALGYAIGYGIGTVIAMFVL